ncbi:MAG: hypothetical protein H0U88_06920, partial [Chthoniobacterales bacterium]|nr:hypothetical protein [Chthoniobacterales bacterium]
VNASIPPGEILYAVTRGFQPYLLYVHAPVRYVRTVDEIPAHARFFVGRPNLFRHVKASERWGDQPPQLLARTKSYRGQETLLFARDVP